MDLHLEVVPAIAVGVLGGMQEDEQVLSQVPGQGWEPGPAGGRQGQMQHLRGEASRGLYELQSRKGSQGQQYLCSWAGGLLGSRRKLTSTSAGVSLQFRTSMTVMTSSVASSRRRRRTRTSSSVISGP